MNKLNDTQIFKFCRQTISDVKLIGCPLDFILWQGKQWAVTEYGLEKRDGTYYVQASDMFNMPTLPDKKQKKTKQFIFVHWFKHLSGKNWCDEDDIDCALQAFLLLFDENGNRTNIKAPILMGDAEAEEYALQAATYAYESTLKKAMQGLFNNAP